MTGRDKPGKKRSPEEVDRIMARIDGMQGAAGHSMGDPDIRRVLRRQAAGEIGPDEAIRLMEQIEDAS